VYNLGTCGEQGKKNRVSNFFSSIGGKVIIVIGGDDHYTTEHEKDRDLFSGWVWWAISSQLSELCETFFIFSWNKKHRAIHEEALLHYIGPSRKGQKFEYEQKQKQPESSNSSSVYQRREDFSFSGAYRSAQATLIQQRKYIDKQIEWEAIRSSSSSSAEQRQIPAHLIMTRGDFSRSADQAIEHSSFSRPSIAGQTRDDHFGSITGTTMASSVREHGAKCKEPPSASTGRTKVTGKGWRANLM